MLAAGWLGRDHAVEDGDALERSACAIGLSSKLAAFA
jgi:hypothetical protein